MIDRDSGWAIRATAAAVAAAVVAVGIAWVGPAAVRAADPAARAGMTRLPAGTYQPLYVDTSKAARVASPRNESPRRVAVAAFDMDVYPVTNAEFLSFVRAHPSWQRSRVKPLFADQSYLRHWKSDLELGPDAPDASPVVNVSWFAVRAYLRWVGKSLPTVDQWEYAAAASETKRDASREPAFLERLRTWYGRPTPARLPAVGSGVRNVYGVRDLHGLIWEWTLDFNSALVTGESRADAGLERMLYCGSGATGASDFEDYAAFMRYAFRSSLEARYGVANLGFRGVVNADTAAVTAGNASTGAGR